MNPSTDCDPDSKLIVLPFGNSAFYHRRPLPQRYDRVAAYLEYQNTKRAADPETVLRLRERWSSFPLVIADREEIGGAFEVTGWYPDDRLARLEGCQEFQFKPPRSPVRAKISDSFRV